MTRAMPHRDETTDMTGRKKTPASEPAAAATETTPANDSPVPTPKHHYLHNHHNYKNK